MPSKLYGLLAEFDDPAAVVRAAQKVRAAGYRRFDAHTPFPVHGLDDAMGLRSTRLPLVVLAAGSGGALLGLGLQFWTNAVDYPLVISGKPLFGLPAAVPVAFELTILCAAISAFLGMLVFNLLPAWYHALFHSRRFRRASADRFFLSVEAADPLFERERTEKFLAGLGAGHVEAVEEEA